MSYINELFYFDSLALTITLLVLFIGFFIASFASRYLKGDINYKRFYVVLASLMISIVTMVSANNLILLFASWLLSNFLLVRLMVHKKRWPAAKESGVLALKTLGIGFVAIIIAFSIFYYVSGTLNIQEVISITTASEIILIPLILIAIAAMTQSGIWPFHKWLISSLNSPTPVSAMMHAGLINGGGFLLARFAPLYLQQSILLTAIFVAGLITVILGTLWKLMQSDVKRMLACSTMGQMGFMFIQAGLGLFPAAVAHLCWHGMFKAYLFLASGNAAQENRLDLGYPPSLTAFALAIICGLFGSYGFAFAVGSDWFAPDTSIVLVIIALIATTQFALPILKNSQIKMLPIAIISSAIIGILYGGSVHLAESILLPLNIMQPQPLNIIHVIGIAVLSLSWLVMLFGYNRKMELPKWVMYLYVKALNSSQPHHKTITTDRNTYKIV